VSLDEPSDLDPVRRDPCPVCASLTRDISVFAEDHAEVHERLSLKARNAGVGAPFLEVISGEELTVSTGRWAHKERVIDRAGRRYRERVVDQQTGEVLRDVDEPLADHRDRGSAKRRVTRG
jgi:hypothetical protein